MPSSAKQGQAGQLGQVRRGYKPNHVKTHLADQSRQRAREDVFAALTDMMRFLIVKKSFVCRKQPNALENMPVI